MNKRIIAFFAATFLSVACTIPAVAEETSGTIKAIDPDRSTLTLDDGTVYELPGEFDYDSIEPGMEIYLIYDQIDSKKVITEIETDE